MITIILFILGLILLVARKYAGVITIITVLASKYLQMNILPNSGIMILQGFEVSDFGLAIYILFFFDMLKRKSKDVRWHGKLQNAVSLFLIFIVLNGVYDCCLGTNIGDVIRYCRKWLFLTLVYIYPCVPAKCVLKSFRQTYYITLTLCLILLLCVVLHVDSLLFKSVGDRGVKPPSFSIVFAVAALTVFFKMPLRKRIVHFIIFFLPIMFNLKMTYAVSVFFMYLLCVFFQRKVEFKKKVLIYVAICASVAVIMVTNIQFSERFFAMANNRELIYKDDESSNLTYRLLHATERWNYICQKPTTLLRGIGYVQEKNFKDDVFEVVAFKKDRQEFVQLDTGDIAWSLFFIRLGVFGLLLYLFMYFRIAIIFFNRRENQRFCYMFALMLVFLFFTSFGNTIIASSDFFIYPILMLNVNAKTLQVKGVAISANDKKNEIYENSTCALELEHGRN